MKNLHKRYRSRIELIILILKAANGGDASRSRMVYVTLLSYNQLKTLLSLLTERDLICYNFETRTFKTTEKGVLLLNSYYEIEKLIEVIEAGQEKGQFAHREASFVTNTIPKKQE